LKFVGAISHPRTNQLLELGGGRKTSFRDVLRNLMPLMALLQILKRKLFQIGSMIPAREGNSGHVA
jgi:hypothetical protein